MIHIVKIERRKEGEVTEKEVQCEMANVILALSTWLHDQMLKGGFNSRHQSFLLVDKLIIDEKVPWEAR